MTRRLSIRVRLAVLVAVGATVVLTLASFGLYRDLSSEISDAITAELEVRFAALAADAANPDAATDQHPVVGQVVAADGGVLSPPDAAPLLTNQELAAASSREILIDREVPALGRRARILARPLDPTNGTVGLAAASTQPLERARTRLLLIVLVAGPVLTGAVTATAWVLAGAALRPVRRMTDRARTISLSARGERLPQPTGRDEIAQLGTTLNDILDRIETTVAHERAFVDDASHELRSPIAVLRGELELALADTDDPATMERSLRSAIEEADRLAALSEHLLILARADAGQMQPGAATVDLLEAARAAVARAPGRAGARVCVEGTSRPVTADPQWVDQMLANLLSNACRHAHGQVRVDVGARDGHPRIGVADDGPGFPPDLLPVAFDRFTRGDTSRGRGGTGLGLAIVASLAGALGATVQATNGPPLGGAHVEIIFPAHRAGS